MSISDPKFTIRKNRAKKISVIVQIIILIVIGFTCVTLLVSFKSYKPYMPQEVKISGDKGFVALSYFGIERRGKQNLVKMELLLEHLRALKNLGYVTISQQDILDYYQREKILPEKSLFLIFEDGRRDTAIFSQKILEELNFKATMLSYADNFEKKDPNFLTSSDLKDLEKTSFWEMGTNGYRLSFINVFDRHDNYLGEMDPLKHVGVAPYLGRRYNHYLMDYIRDEYNVPKESYTRMKDRVSYDYEALRDMYTNSIGYVPQLYILMHSNTGSFGNNDRVSAVNAYWIKELFKMNFNREGFCFNQKDSSIYDLTRMQPQSYWSTNHLLMRIKHAANQDVEFVKGDRDKQKAWETIKGASEIKTETIILTSMPKSSGLMRLKGSDNFVDLNLTVRLKGNKVGLQKIYLRADEGLNRYLAVYLFNNYLYVTEKTGEAEKEMFKLDLRKFDGVESISVAEDKKAAEIRELEIFLKYADSVEKAKVYTERLKDKNLESPPTLAQGAAEYIPALSIHAAGDRTLVLSLKEDKIGVILDGREIVKDLKTSYNKVGAVYLESAWGDDYGWSQRNLADTVYDGVFEKLVITSNRGAQEGTVLYDGRMKGYEAFVFKAEQYWESVLEWFMR